MNDFADLKLTPVKDEAEIEGVWTDYPVDNPAFEKMRLRIARARNPRFRKEFNRLHRPYQRKSSKLTEDVAENILVKSMAYGILVDWELVTKDGVEYEYSREAAETLLRNDPDLRDYVMEFSEDIENFVSESEDDIVKK